MWSLFEQSAVEDETISNAFSSRGIFKIRSEEEVVQYPNVQASIQNKKMVIAIDKNIALLEDEMVAKCSFLSFSSVIDAIAISATGNLIICGLQDGEIHGIFIKGIPVFNLRIRVEDVPLDSAGGATFASIQELGQQFYMTCTNGSVYCLSVIDESPLEEYLNISLADENIELAENLLGEVTIERLTTGRDLKGISAAVLLPSPCSRGSTRQPMLVAGVSKAVHFRVAAEDKTRISLPDCYGGVKRIFNLENVLLVLTNSGQLLEVCPITRLIHLQCFKDVSKGDLFIDEMLVMECSDDNIELLILTKSNISEEGRTMKIIEYPSLKCHSELEVSQHSWLVQQPKCSVNLYYLSSEQLNAAQQPMEVEMVLVSETHPSERFKRLIAKGHLEEAEDFGRQFELSLQPIYEAKAKRILLELTALGDNNPELLDQRFEELLAKLNLIENKQFFRNNRMIALNSRRILERYLKTVLTHLDKTTDKPDILEVVEQLHRLETLDIIDPYEVNSEWQKYIYQPNLMKWMLTLFKTDLPTACLVWKRHSSAIMPHLDDNQLIKLLTLLPSNTEAFNLVQWLRHFVPTVSSTHPNVLPTITDWAIQKTRALQYADYWPEIGLEFSTKVMDIFEDIQYLHSDIDRQHERNIAKLRNLINSLQDLAVLKKSYNLIITIDNYMQDSNDATAIYILERVQLEKLKSLVNDFLYPIYRENGTAPVTALRRYISLLVASRNALSTWLQRAVVCTELLHNEDDRLECALLVLQNSPCPWPETVTPLVKLRNSTHPLALKISSEHEFQVIKIMKVKYGWPANCAADINLNLFMQRIVKLDLPDMLDDIRTLTKAAPHIMSSANFNCCYQLVRRGKSDVAYEFFKSLGDKTSKHTNDIIELFADILETSVSLPEAENGKCLEEQRNLIDFFKIIANHADEVTRRRAKTIERRHVLQHRFHLSVPCVQQIVSQEQRLKLLDLGIEDIIARRESAVGGVSRFMASEIAALCAALALPRLQGDCRLSQRLHCLPLTCALTYAHLEYIAADSQALNDNRIDAIELALELIVQQMLATRSQSTGNATQHTFFSETSDPLALVLAQELLLRASLTERKRPAELLDLLKYLHVACGDYASTAIEEYYNHQECAIDEKICKTLAAAEAQLNGTLNTNDSEIGDGEKRRYSIFDMVDVPQQPQAQQIKHQHHNSEHVAIVRFVARTLLLLLVDEKEPSNTLFAKLRQRLPNAVRLDMERARDDFFQSLEQLIKAKAHNVWYIVVQYLLQHQQREGVTSQAINADFVSLQLRRVFRNALSQREVNFIDLFVMLMADSHCATLLPKLERDLRSDQQKMNLLTLLEMYNIHMGEAAEVEVIRAKRVKHFYYMEFCQQDSTMQNKFNVDVDDVKQLLKVFPNKLLDVELLARMSKDFGLDYQQLLVNQMLNILRSQELQYETKTVAHGDEQLVVLSSVETMRQLCQPYLNEIKSTELLANKLLPFLTGEVNFYFYELYLCIIEMLLFLDAAPPEMQLWSSILHFLRHKMVTRRRNRPGQTETDMWLDSQTELSVLPNISRYRLPFKAIVELPLKDVLSNELNVDNCDTWFPLIQMHTMLKDSQEIKKTLDYFCMAAVKNSILEYSASNDRARNNAKKWHLQPTNNAFLKSVQRLVKHMHDPAKAFLMLYFVSNYAPEGADQVEACFECYKFGQENEQLITDPKCQEHLSKIKRTYPTIKTQHLLHVYGLTDEKLIRLVEHPTELICKLYQHELVLHPGKLAINAVVTEIAQLHSIDLEVIQFQLLQKWLSVTLDCPDSTIMDETFSEETAPASSNHCVEDASNAAENVIRAHYVLKSWPKKSAVQFLVAHIFPSNGAVNTSKQLKMYECFMKLNDGSASFSSMLNQHDYVAIKCVHELKQLGYNTSVDKFVDCNKVELLPTLWKRGSRQALNVLANICLGYDIYLDQVWNGILQRMVKEQMVRELNALVDVLSCQPVLLPTAGLAMAWGCVLLQPFRNADRAPSVEQEELLNKTVFRLQSCPVLHSLKLLEFAKHCVELERIHLAAVILALSKQPDQREEIKAFILKNRKRPLNDSLRRDILALEEAGILPVVLNVALKELDL